MKNISVPDPENLSDASLVELSLAGDHEAFGRIVTRYQSPICALAYSACGDVARSHDLAQEIFITAWRKLTSLREPARFKAWLYGIARNLIHNTFRQNRRNPVALAESLADAPEPTAVTHEPDAQAISKEEEAILWRVLAGLPEIYREPMVLFYRQNESIQRVADVLAISEEAVRQRLSRGRALLNERVTKVIEQGLRRTGPADTFAAAVIAALPALASVTTTKGTVVGLATAKGATSQATGLVGMLKSLFFFAGLVAVPAALGSYFGHKLGQDAGGSPEQRRSAAKFWRVFGAGLVLFLFLPLILTFAITGFLHDETRAGFLSVMTVWLGLAYPFVIGVLIYWCWQRRRQRSATPAGEAGAPEEPMRQLAEAVPAATPWRISKRLVLFMTVAAAGLLAFCAIDTGRNVVRPSADQLHELITQSAPGDLRVSISVCHYRSLFKVYPETYRWFLVEDRQAGKKTLYCAPVDEVSVALLAQKGIACPTYIEGRDFEVLGAPGRFLPFLAAFVLAVGAIFLIKRRRSAGPVPKLLTH
jgi:RNA polymerase sigma factor (sigma-70 family)